MRVDLKEELEHLAVDDYDNITELIDELNLLGLRTVCRHVSEKSEYFYGVRFISYSGLSPKEYVYRGIFESIIPQYAVVEVRNNFKIVKICAKYTKDNVPALPSHYNDYKSLIAFIVTKR